VRARRAVWLASLGLSLILGIGACVGAPEPGPAATGLDLSAFGVVDLSHPFDERTLYWPTSPSRFELERLSWGETEGGWFYAANRFCTPEHGGTHLDAPVHFAEGRWTADQIPPERLVGPGVVIDVSARAAADPDYRLSGGDVLAWEEAHGRVPAGAIVLLRTGWDRFWPDARRYLGGEAPGDASDLHFPSYGEEAARLLVTERRVSMLGVDTASIDHGPSSRFEVHRLAGAADVPGLENLTGLDEVPPTGAWVVALPMKIAGGSGGPLRAIALIPEER
jgi:kynurenine formamidase